MSFSAQRERPTEFFVEYLNPEFWAAVERGEEDAENWDPYDTREYNTTALADALAYSHRPDREVLSPRIHRRIEIEWDKQSFGWRWRDCLLRDCDDTPDAEVSIEDPIYIEPPENSP